MYILLIILLSAALCFGVVYPLWFFATESPYQYTFIILILAVAGLTALIVSKILKKLKSFTTDDGKKKFRMRFFFGFCIILVLFIAIINSVKLVLREQRLFALLVLAAGIVISFILKKVRTRFSDV